MPGTGIEPARAEARRILSPKLSSLGLFFLSSVYAVSPVFMRVYREIATGREVYQNIPGNTENDPKIALTVLDGVVIRESLKSPEVTRRSSFVYTHSKCPEEFLITPLCKLNQ